jgi:ABC-type transporter Mla subunit MlaD
MTHPIDPLDRLVEDYLAEVARATAGLPAARREDLIADLREHITVARADLDPPTQAGIRTILDRLGEPAAIAEEARLGESVSAASPSASPYGAPYGPGYGPSYAAPTLGRPVIRPRRSSSTLVLVLGAVLVVIVIVVGACSVTLFSSGGEAPSPEVETRSSQTAPAPR